MIIALVLQLAAAAPDSVRPLTLSLPGVALDAQQDTTRRRRRAVEVSDAYGQRLLIHRWASYAAIPAFGAQYWAGQKLYDAEKAGREGPDWAKSVHTAGAISIAGIFGINTLTGAWNLWDSRHTEQHRWLRLSHSLTMLGADAAFMYTGIALAQDAEHSQVKRDQHRRVALYAIGVSTVSGVTMKILNR